MTYQREQLQSKREILLFQREQQTLTQRELELIVTIPPHQDPAGVLGC
jgi:hypothetical protein